LYHGGVAFEPVFGSALVALSVATFYLFSGIVPQGFALLAGQLMLVALPVFAALALGGGPRVIGLRRPRARFVGAAILIGLTAWYLNMRLVMWLEPPRDELRHLEQLVDSAPLLEALVMLAVLPPICEEILFRGVLARSLATKLPIWIAIALSALLFSAYHLSLVQAPATFTLGLVFALIAIRSDSVVPSILAHGLNNGLAVLVSRDELAPLARWLGHNPTPALAICGTATATGVALIITGARA